MENTKTNKTAVIASAILVVTVLAFFLMVFLNDKKQLDKPKTSFEIEQEQYEKFSTEVRNKLNSYDTTGKTKEEVEIYSMNVIDESARKYPSSGATQVRYQVASKLGDEEEDSGSFLDSIKGALDFFKNKDKDKVFEGVKYSKEIKMPSKIVCNLGIDKKKYCLDSMNAKIHVVDENSGNWVVLIHGFTQDNIQIYNALGEMYTSQGFNVIAPDLRGAGKTGGEVAMGYLESLDVYDWIKDLNENYNDPNRYGVKVQPDTLIVHGVSLGGATTVQLATNPDIAAAKGAPYTKSLTQLGVKGFVDDCGYTSMSGIIKTMLNIDSSSKSNSMFDMLGINKDDFSKTLKEVAKKLNLDGIANLKPEIGIDPKDFINFLEQLQKETGKLPTSPSIPDFEWPSIDGVKPDFIKPEIKPDVKPDYRPEIKPDYRPEIKPDYRPDYRPEYQIPGMPHYDSDKFNQYLQDLNKHKHENRIPGLRRQSNDGLNIKFADPMANTKKINTDDLMEKLVKFALIKGVAIGLTEDNYDLYSNSFAPGRKFPDGAKVMIVHGTDDFMVSPKHGVEIANQIINNSNAQLLYKWDVEGESHAFIVFNAQREKYAKLVKNYTDCVAHNKCSAFENGNNPTR